jgi:aspartate carbamoyltransferase catalytic subunit
MFTIQRHKGGIEGLKVAIIGDSLHSRVARSNCYGLAKMGAKVTLAGSSTLLPVNAVRLGAETTTDIREAVRGADVVMALRIQRERQQGGSYPSLKDYSEFFGLNRDVIALAKKDALIMHPGPMNRGVEITSELADGGSSVIGEQVTNGLAVRMALLYLLTRRPTNE